MPGHEHAGLDDLQAAGHDLKRHLAGAHERLLQRRVLGRTLSIGVLGHPVSGSEGFEGASVLVDERQQVRPRVVQLDELGPHPLLDIGVLLLAHGEVAHHGSQRRRKRPRIGRGPASTGSRGL